jgi:hypothetical protein
MYNIILSIGRASVFVMPRLLRFAFVRGFFLDFSSIRRESADHNRTSRMRAAWMQKQLLSPHPPLPPSKKFQLLTMRGFYLDVSSTRMELHIII